MSLSSPKHISSPTFTPQIKEYTLANVFTPPRTPTLRYAPGELTGRRRPRPANRSRETHVETESALQTEPGQSNAIFVSHTNGGSGAAARSGGGGEGTRRLRMGENVEPGIGRPVGGKKALLNTIVNKYKKKYRKNRRGRKMGPGRKGGVPGVGGRRRRIGGHRKFA